MLGSGKIPQVRSDKKCKSRTKIEVAGFLIRKISLRAYFHLKNYNKFNKLQEVDYYEGNDNEIEKILSKSR